jgi:hypothetical protein
MRVGAVLQGRLGKTDHSWLTEKIVGLLPPRESFGSPIDLQVGELRYPSGRVQKYFTYYAPRQGGVNVLHGLHREYTEAGALIELEYRHGVPIAPPRIFDEKGQEVGRPC